MQTTLEQSVEIQQNFSPLLMQANHILSLSQTDLEAAINDAIEENPALELDDCVACPICGRRTSGEPCPTCRTILTDMQPARSDDALPRHEVDYRISSAADPDFDPMSIIATGEDAKQQILEWVQASLRCPREQAIAMVLVDALDSRGFLTIDLDEIAAMTGAEMETVERVLATIQEVSPAGVGARSLQECLLLQAHYLGADGVEVPAAVFPIVADHLESLAAKRWVAIARALDVSETDVERAVSFIRDQLTPHPLQSQLSATWTSPSTSGHVVPDVVVTLDGNRLSIEVPNAIYDRIGTNAFYRAIARPASSPTGSTAAEQEPRLEHFDPETISHAKAQIGRAQQFIWAVRQRRQTLLRVAEYVCDYQEAFIRGDARGLRPLTRSEVANALGVHESTCSRAVAGKFIMLPTRKVIPMSDLFQASLSVKHVIQQIIREESTAGRTLSDAQISDRLLDHGIRIARRTVAKYRGQMHILPSTIR